MNEGEGAASGVTYYAMVNADHIAGNIEGRMFAVMEISRVK